MSTRPEALVAQVLRSWLLLQLPAKVAAVNALRAPVLTAPYAGPYNVTAGMKLWVTVDGRDSWTPATLTTGAARTAAQVAADVNALGGAFATMAGSDAEGRLVLTGTAPTAAQQLVGVGMDGGGGGAAETGSNALFGWNPGGEFEVRSPLLAPCGTGVCDGWPVVLDCGPGFWVIIGKRGSVPVNPGDVRRDEWLVALEMTLMNKDTNVQNSRSREAIEACVQCVREVLLTDLGRYVGRAGQGDVMKLEERQVVIPGTPWLARNEKGEELGIFDTATYALSVRVFTRPASS